MTAPDRHLAFIVGHQVAFTGRGVVVWAGLTLHATFDESQEPLFDGTGQVIECSRVLRMQASALPAIAKRYNTIVVDGDRYQVKDILKQGDGLEVLVPIAPAA